MNAIITVVGNDKVGIIASVSSYLAQHKINIEDITQTILSGNFVMMMMVNFESSDISIDEFRLQMAKNGGGNQHNERKSFQRNAQSVISVKFVRHKFQNGRTNFFFIQKLSGTKLCKYCRMFLLSILWNFIQRDGKLCIIIHFGGF